MDLELNVDALWGAFSDTLPPELRHDAGQLARWLGLVPVEGIPWSAVFQHEITLGAPALFAPALPQASPAMVRSAVLAHLLAIIEAFATDRIEDQQVVVTPALVRLLERIREARDRSLESLTGPGSSTYPDAERRTLAAIGAERVLLEDGSALSFADYACLSLAKQSAAFPGSAALAEAAGWEAPRRRVIRRILEDIVLGLQYHDDVVDWEDDWRRGGAWAVSLSRGIQRGACRADRAADAELVRRTVHGSGVLARMLGQARLYFQEASMLAEDLGVLRVAAWAGQQARRAGELADGEKDSAGFAVRAHLLAAWATQVLS